MNRQQNEFNLKTKLAVPCFDSDVVANANVANLESRYIGSDVVANAKVANFAKGPSYSMRAHYGYGASRKICRFRFSYAPPPPSSVFAEYA